MSSFFIWSLLFSIFISGINQSGAEELPGITMHSIEYMEGERTAGESKYPGEFALGFGIGMTMPFVVGVASSSTYQSLEKIGNRSMTRSSFTAIAGVVSGELWYWSGKKIIKGTDLRVPEKALADYNERQKSDFLKGYSEPVRKKRITAYNHGVIAGTLFITVTTVVLFYYFISTIEMT